MISPEMSNTYQPIMNDPVPMQTGIKLPFDVSNELNIYSRVYIAKENDPFRIFHCSEIASDYIVYGELPDGDKKILFTSKQRYECCTCCKSCLIPMFCCEYECCDSIVFQMEYKRNNVNFYTQGNYIQSGFYCCKCLCCCQLCCCCNPNILFLRENLDPDNPDFNVGVKKGSTTGVCCFGDRVVFYTTQEGMKGPTVKGQCCDPCSAKCDRYCGLGCDIEMVIEDANGQQTGSIYVANGICSKKVEGTCCYRPGKNYVVNFPPNSSSTEKFQIIADIVHFDLTNRIL